VTAEFLHLNVIAAAAVGSSVGSFVGSILGTVVISPVISPLYEEWRLRRITRDRLQEGTG